MVGTAALSLRQRTAGSKPFFTPSSQGSTVVDGVDGVGGVGGKNLVHQWAEEQFAFAADDDVCQGQGGVVGGKMGCLGAAEDHGGFRKMGPDGAQHREQVQVVPDVEADGEYTGAAPEYLLDDMLFAGTAGQFQCLHREVGGGVEVGPEIPEAHGGVNISGVYGKEEDVHGSDSLQRIEQRKGPV